MPIAFRKISGRKQIIREGDGEAGARPSQFKINEELAQGAVLRSFAKALKWMKLVDEGKAKSVSELSEIIGVDRHYILHTLRCATLSPRIIRAALAGKIAKTPIEMAEMFSCDRALHNTHPETGINAEMAAGYTVISDRYYYSSLAYQGAALGYDTVAKLNLDREDIRTPDLCIFLDLTPDKSLERIGKRGEATEIYENFDYLTKTRKMFFDVFEKLENRGENIAIIDASGAVEDIADNILSQVLKFYNI